MQQTILTRRSRRVFILVGVVGGLALAATGAKAAPNDRGHYQSGGNAQYAPVTPAYAAPGHSGGTGRRVG